MSLVEEAKLRLRVLDAKGRYMERYNDSIKEPAFWEAWSNYTRTTDKLDYWLRQQAREMRIATASRFATLTVQDRNHPTP